MRLISLIFLAVLIPVSLMAQGGCGGPCSGGGGGGCGGACSTAGEDSKAVLSTVTLAALVRSNAPVCILDCREDQDYTGKRIPGAHRITREISGEELGKLIPGKDFLIITYDSSPSSEKRAIIAEMLRKTGYSNILDYPSGLAEWEKSGQEVELDKPAQNDLKK